MKWIFSFEVRIHNVSNLLNNEANFTVIVKDKSPKAIHKNIPDVYSFNYNCILWVRTRSRTCNWGEYFVTRIETPFASDTHSATT